MDIERNLLSMNWLTLLAHLIGFVCAIVALWRARTTQGATAWVVGLLGFPKLMVPLFIVFGRNKFYGYVKRRQELDAIAHEEMGQIEQFTKEQVAPPASLKSLSKIAKLSAQPGFMDCNAIDLLIDGKETFDSMYEAIRSAKRYVLFQFYVIRPDEIGSRFADLLIQKAQEGVRVYILYDGVGTSLHRKFLKRLRDAGVRTSRFSSTRFAKLQIQINFRNHRKVVVVDGQTAFIGGINVGDEYLGRNPEIGPWRDTHCRIVGPAALAAQLSFLKDWNWSEEEVLDLEWESLDQKEGSHVLVLHTGPADDAEVAQLAHIALIEKAQSRVWIANPYVVPPEGIMTALAAAALRGVDVRILMPSFSDNPLVLWASDPYVKKMLPLGIQIRRYMPGFLHQKVVLIDDAVASVGSINLDARSLFINFEITAITPHPPFVKAVHKMLESDFAQSEPLTMEELAARPFWMRLRARAMGLLAPVL